MLDIICEKNKCTGCFACMEVCRCNAIVKIEDELGNVYPQIDQKKCVSCGMCKKICPENSKPKLLMVQEVYAAWAKEESIESASGGIADAFARYIINNNGCVYGAISESANILHKRISSLEEIEKLRGSKYVKSNIKKCYSECEKDLKNGKDVLFIGTPCQIAGLKAYLRKDFENLITVDLICHGTPSQKYLQEYLDNEIGNGKWDRVTFRGKYDWKLTAYKGNKIVYQENKEYDSYFLGFLEAITYRENCYHCSYAKKERIGDITIGDFWGLNKELLRIPYEGKISLILVMSDNGKQLLDKCKKFLIMEKRNIEEAANPSQHNLLHPSLPGKDREKFLKLYPKYGFVKAMNKTEIGKKIKNAKIRRTIKEIPLMKNIIKVINRVR